MKRDACRFGAAAAAPGCKSYIRYMIHEFLSRVAPAVLIALNKPYGMLCQFTADAGRRQPGRLRARPARLSRRASRRRQRGTPAPHRRRRAAGAHRRSAPQARESLLGAGGGRAGTPPRFGRSPRASICRTGVRGRRSAAPRWPTRRSGRAIRRSASGATSRPPGSNSALREGRNRQVRRMTASVGHPTLRLVRVRVGPWALDGLGPGEWREVDARLIDSTP